MSSIRSKNNIIYLIFKDIYLLQIQYRQKLKK